MSTIISVVSQVFLFSTSPFKPIVSTFVSVLACNVLSQLYFCKAVYPTVSTFVSISACAVLLVGYCIVYTYEYDYHV